MSKREEYLRKKKAEKRKNHKKKSQPLVNNTEFLKS